MRDRTSWSTSPRSGSRGSCAPAIASSDTENQPLRSNPSSVFGAAGDLRGQGLRPEIGGARVQALGVFTTGLLERPCQSELETIEAREPIVQAPPSSVCQSENRALARIEPGEGLPDVGIDGRPLLHQPSLSITATCGTDGPTEARTTSVPAGTLDSGSLIVMSRTGSP